MVSRLIPPVGMVSLLVFLVFGIYRLCTGRRLHSPVLMADARDYLVNSLSTAVVVLSLGGAYFGLHLDR
jgi:divalent metal cation (Fe/Co/Zn/Cd) transporter